ncbi:MAG: DUF1704 domain-containing protein [Acidimicrobiia bacterium]|nr:DUF1704 domain-containing protein [Acidimicrobiia bacterium]
MRASVIDPAAVGVDSALVRIAAELRFLVWVTPDNWRAERQRCTEGGHAPRFTYAPVSIDVAATTEELTALPVEEVTDHRLQRLLDDKRRELTLLTEMLGCRDTPRFRELSIEASGVPSKGLVATATDLLERVARRPPAEEHVDGEAFARRARAELDRYRQVLPDLVADVVVDPASSGLMVAGADVLVAPDEQIPAERVEALIAHEVGIHVLTYVNGQRQPLGVLADGLAGYEATQEGLGVLAEYLAGGLTANRLRELAVRVVAVDRMLDDRSFLEVYDEIVGYGFDSEAAFVVAMRVFRSGGLVKDAGYLEGFIDVVDHLRRGGSLDTLWLGKFALGDLAVVEELLADGVLRPAALRPFHAHGPSAQRRLAALAEQGLRAAWGRA